ncbi:uncharacterized protein Triagg1_5824 [Trichoderma aggressivum f. europaeum]|uniref:RRM domain-containing protein n=1 Tax=Trichoderma aggressivum f. europaeum TaxID=173218 RepID=A0AAE1ICM8_9HYPO|nr:hypothetical protein Triagg1_5824 [Trichoderma aggressivum f. europaeum]
MGDSGDFVRLHVTPLDAELIKVVVPTSVLPTARNISYHTLETFPERRYGFVELLEADAEKLRKKLNGTTLKGCKMRIEKARPETRVEPNGDEDEVPEKKKKKPSKKRKREPDVLEGVALHDRQVKRGWTETPTTTTTKRRDRKDKDKESKEKKKEKEKMKRPKSKYTEGEECLLKTKLPPNTMKNLAPEELEHKKRSKKKGSSRQVVIHEFEKTTKFPSFLKAATATGRKTATEYVKGKGWVDEEGNVVEEVKEKEKAQLPQRPKKVPQPRKVSEEPEDDDSTSSSGTSSEGTSSEDKSEEESEAESEEEIEAEVEKQAAEVPVRAPTKPQDEEEKDDDSDSSSDNTSDSGSSSDEEEEEPSKVAEQTTPTTSKPNAPKSTPTSNKPLAIKIPPPETPSAGKVHPLEALYKRPKQNNENPTSVPKEEPFSFFGGGEDEEDNESGAAPSLLVPPMTPFTSQDFEWRNVRSAAPTPDTAHPSRMQRFWGASPEKDVEMEDDVANALREEEQEDEEGEDEDDGSPAQGRQTATTDFQKWFWENRRDLNRSWMTRRKTAAKEKRHRENKARASKAV